MKTYLRSLFTLFVLSSLSVNSWGQVTTGWVSALGAGGINNDYPGSVATDSQGNLFVCGSFSSPTIAFGSITLVNANAGSSDLFLVKYNAAGTVVWAKSAGGFGSEGFASIAIDAGGNIYVAGNTNTNSFTLDNVTILGPSSFLFKYDTNGNVLWSRVSLGGNGSFNNSVSKVVVDAADNIILGGTFYSASIRFDNMDVFPLAIGYNTYLYKFDNNGNALWAKGTSGDALLSLSVDNAGNITTIINDKAGVYFGNSSTLISSPFPNNDNIFLGRYDTNGNLIWAKTDGGNASDYAFGIGSDNAQNFYICGYFHSDSVQFGNHTIVKPVGTTQVMFLVKYNSGGIVQWAKTATGNAYGYYLHIDASNNIYLNGKYSGATLDFGTLILNNHTPPNYYSNIFLAKYDTSGNIKWARSDGSAGSGENPSQMTASTDGYLYLSGYYFDPTINFGNTTLTNNGANDMFIAKLDEIAKPVVAFVLNKCFNEPDGYGRLVNPPGSNYTLTVKLDGNPLNYNSVDSSFRYFISGSTPIGQHNINVTYARGNLSMQTDTSFSVASSLPASISIGASGNNICAGTSVIFTAAATNGGTNPFYQWQVNGVNAGINSNTFTTSTLNNNDQVKVILTSSSVCASPQNATSNIITMLVTATPTAHAGNDTTICAGSSVQLNASGGTLYSWSPATGLSNPNIANPVATPSATTTYVLTVSNGGSCSATDAVVIMVTPSVIPGVIINTASTTICMDDIASFIATPDNGGTAPSYQWQVNGVNAGINSNVFNTSTLTDNAQVKVILTSSLGCASPATATSNSITMTVSPVPVANAGNDVSICNGSSTQLQASGGTVYSWFPATGLSNPNIANPLASPAVTTNYCVVVSNALNCSSVDSVMVTVDQPSAAPAVSISTSNNSICLGTAATFTAVPTSGGSNPAYQWQVDAVNAGTNSNVFTSTSLQNNSQVKVILTSSSGCVTIPTATSNTITMNVDQLATPQLSVNSPVFTVSNPDALATYNWQVQNGTVWADVVPTASSIVYTAPAAGEYRVKAVKGACIQYSASGTANFNAPYSHFIDLYPNPAHGYITLDSIALVKKYETVEIIDMHGKRVLPLYNVINRTSITIDISLLSKGVYMAIVRQKDGTYTAKRFIKQ